MTLSTSAVAVCCWRDSRSSLSRRVFSIAITAWAAKFWTSSICLSVNGRTSWRYMKMAPISASLFEHGHGKDTSRLRRLDERDGAEIALDIGLLLGEVGNMQHLFGSGDAGERNLRMPIAQLDHRFPPQ